MNTFANKIIDVLSFYQWINVEHSMVKRQYKELSEDTKKQLQKDYDVYYKYAIEQ